MKRCPSAWLVVALVCTGWAIDGSLRNWRPGTPSPWSVRAQTRGLDPAIERLLEQISAERLSRTVAALQAFDTRHTLSSGAPGRGIAAAAQWIHDELRAASPRLQVAFDEYDVPAQGGRIVRDVRLRNVVAVLAGRSPRRIYISAHYDSVARVPATAAVPSNPSARPDRPRPDPEARGPSAGGTTIEGGQREPASRPRPDEGRFDWSSGDHFQPGANDDGSGTALTMELARVLAGSGIEFDATLVFAAFAGEEQGLVGALLHAQTAAAGRWSIDAVFNNDMVGNVAGGNGLADSGSVRVFSEGPEDSVSRQIARYTRRTAARYVPGHRVRLIARHDRFGRGGDHTAFNQHGFPGVRITESNENFARQHTALDTADGVSGDYMAANARVNAAAVASLALAPPAPAVNDEDGRPLLGRGTSGYDAQLRWRASPGASGYRIVWRAAWTPDWQHELLVGNVTEHVLRDMSIDDHVFGVAALDGAGHESLVAPYVNPPRPEEVIRGRRRDP